MMKKIQMILSIFVVALVVAACGSTTPEPTPPVIEDNQGETNDAPVTGQQDAEQEKQGDDQVSQNDDQVNQDNSGDSTTNDDEATKMEQLAYIDFDLKVDYRNSDEYEAELELKHNGYVDAKIEDEINGVKKEGPQAFEELYALVEQLTITQSTSRADAIQEVLSVFNLDSNYEEFELEIKFKDGTKIEFKDEK